ncbi:glycosyltransferase [Psychrobacter sp.]|uniref:glycosyltransferase n=1 Tax=Psychrobacter sp. TaxID=56811 RepID=UPI0025FC1574|nr:glycosyltransferase [Psychrobacter sp.]
MPNLNKVKDPLPQVLEPVLKIGIVIPAHNEAETISDCLASVQIAIDQLPSFIEAYPLVVLDSCTDNTLDLVMSKGVDYLILNYRCVGQVRDTGIRHVISQGATWVACTDADSLVNPDWLIQQGAHIEDSSSKQGHCSKSCDMICGVVSINDWDHLTDKTKKKYLAHYQDMMGHRHIHGANLSFSSEAYLKVGGFANMPCHEDVDLVKRFEAKGYNIVWSNKVRVVTSSRLQARAKEGFAAFLTNLEHNG